MCIRIYDKQTNKQTNKKRSTSTIRSWLSWIKNAHIEIEVDLRCVSIFYSVKFVEYNFNDVIAMTTMMAAAAVIEIVSNFDVTIEAAIQNAMNHYVTTTAVNHSDYYEMISIRKTRVSNNLVSRETMTCKISSTNISKRSSSVEFSF